MTKTEAIAIISAALPALDDEGAAKLAAVAQSLARTQASASETLRALTPEELAGIERSKEDFEAGRTYTMSEARALSDVFLQELRAKYPNAP